MLGEFVLTSGVKWILKSNVFEAQTSFRNQATSKRVPTPPPPWPVQRQAKKMAPLCPRSFTL